MEKELIEWISDMYSDMSEENKKKALEFFPDLINERAERIQNALIGFFTLNKAKGEDYFDTDILTDEVLAWLKRQGKKEPDQEQITLLSDLIEASSGRKKEVLMSILKELKDVSK